jgi:hypothetical protein
MSARDFNPARRGSPPAVPERARIDSGAIKNCEGRHHRLRRFSLRGPVRAAGDRAAPTPGERSAGVDPAKATRWGLDDASRSGRLTLASRPLIADRESLRRTERDPFGSRPSRILMANTSAESAARLRGARTITRSGRPTSLDRCRGLPVCPRPGDRPWGGRNRGDGHRQPRREAPSPTEHEENEVVTARRPANVARGGNGSTRSSTPEGRGPGQFRLAAIAGNAETGRPSGGQGPEKRRTA